MLNDKYILTSQGSFLSETELYHHGIKGMKWGVRRYQNLDGSLTTAGKKRYSDGESVNTSKKNTKTNDTEFSRKGIIQKRKDKLVEQYISKGYKPGAAKTMADQRIRTEALLAVVGTIAVTAVAIKVSRRIGQDYLDRTFKAGKIIQNIGANKNANFKDSPFFAAVNKSDKKAYRMLYPNEKRGMVMDRAKEKGARPYDGIYNNSIKLTDNVKRASVANARKIFYDKMSHDPQFKKNVIEKLRKTGYYDRSAINKYLETGKHSKKLYDRFNQALATPEFQKAGLHKQYYDEVKKHGYNAILDINDARYSGYKIVAKSPTIFFGNDKWEKLSSKKLTDSEIDKNVTKFNTELITKNILKEIGLYGVGYASLESITDQIIIKNYLDKHPNSKLSRKEILELSEK